MKIAVAQTSPAKGNIAANMEAHIRMIHAAIACQTNLIIFPELSLTGYEPALAQDLAVTIDDHRLDVFQKLSNEGNIAIGAGVPVRGDTGVFIGLVLFQPHQRRTVYSKQYLHPDEYPYFVKGTNQTLTIDGTRVALAICYEISVPEHTASAFAVPAPIYVASVVKFPRAIAHATETLSATAKKYHALVLMSNCVGVCDGETCGGNSSAWNSEGELIAQLGDKMEGLLVVDTSTMIVEIKEFQSVGRPVFG